MLGSNDNLMSSTLNSHREYSPSSQGKSRSPQFVKMNQAKSMLSKLARMKETKEIQGQEVVISFNGDDVGEHARDVAIQSTPMQM